MPAITRTGEELRAARSHTREVCRRHHVVAERADDAVTIVSELIGNAVRHGKHPCAYDVSMDHGDVLITVDDAERAGPAEGVPSGSVDESGRGLFIVASLARRWGWMPRPHGKRVWARV